MNEFRNREISDNLSVKYSLTKKTLGFIISSVFIFFHTKLFFE